MCDRDHQPSSNDTMSNTDPSPVRVYKDGKTCVFWDVEDYPIPNGLDPASIHQSIKEAIKKQGCHGEVSIQAYADKNTFSDELRSKFSDAGFKFDTEVDNYARNCAMYCDIMLWVLKNPIPANVIVLAKMTQDDLALRISGLCWRSYGVLISQPKREWEFPDGSDAPFLTSIFDGGNLGGSSLRKRKLADTLTGSED